MRFFDWLCGMPKPKKRYVFTPFERYLMAVLDDLKAAVVSNTNAVNAAVFALGQIAPSGVPEADVAAATATIAADAARLAAAIPVVPAA